MNFEALAIEFMETMHQMRKRKTQKQLNDSMKGESFVLLYISRHEGNVIPSDISNEMGISSARIAATLNSLEGKGLIVRRIDEQDRRRILIDLTEAGRNHVQDHHKMIMGITTNMFRYLGEEDAKEFIRIMKRLADKGPEDFV
jgi:Transcriptional regulators